MKFTTPDNETFQGRSYEDIVQHMASMKMDEPSSLEGYMRSTASRVREMYGVEVDASSPESFVRTLEEHDLLVRS